MCFNILKDLSQFSVHTKPLFFSKHSYKGFNFVARSNIVLVPFLHSPFFLLSDKCLISLFYVLNNEFHLEKICIFFLLTFNPVSLNRLRTSISLSKYNSVVGAVIKISSIKTATPGIPVNYIIIFR